MKFPGGLLPSSPLRALLRAMWPWHGAGALCRGPGATAWAGGYWRGEALTGEVKGTCLAALFVQAVFWREQKRDILLGGIKALGAGLWDGW